MSTLQLSVLDNMNAELQRHGLKPLITTGDRRRGEVELTGIRSVIGHSDSTPLATVEFTCVRPDGSDGLYTMRFSEDGVVIIALIKGKIAFVRQLRHPLGLRRTELPRAFGTGSIYTEDAVSTLFEEVAPAAFANPGVYLGSVPQDSGTDTSCPAYWLYKLDVEPKVLKNRRSHKTANGLELLLWTYDEAMKSIANLDAHSIVGLALLRAYLEGAK